MFNAGDTHSLGLWLLYLPFIGREIHTLAAPVSRVIESQKR